MIFQEEKSANNLIMTNSLTIKGSKENINTQNNQNPIKIYNPLPNSLNKPK